MGAILSDIYEDLDIESYIFGDTTLNDIYYDLKKNDMIINTSEPPYYYIHRFDLNKKEHYYIRRDYDEYILDYYGFMKYLKYINKQITYCVNLSVKIDLDNETINNILKIHGINYYLNFI